MITDRSSLSSPVWPQDQTVNTLDTQNLFSAFLRPKAQSTPAPSHRYTDGKQSVYLYRPNTYHSISDALYKKAEPEPSVAFIIKENASGNYALDIPIQGNRRVFVTHFDPKDTLYAHKNAAGTGIEVIRRKDTGLHTAQDIMIQETEAPHIFRLFNNDATLGPELYAYPREVAVPPAFTNRQGWNLADPASYDSILSNAFTRTDQGTKQQVNNFLGPIPAKELNLTFPPPHLAQKHNPSSAPISAHSSNIADEVDMNAIAAQNNAPPTVAESSKTITAADSMNDADFAAYLREIEAETTNVFGDMHNPEVDYSSNKGKGRAI